jgi:hypothetical protein
MKTITMATMTKNLTNLMTHQYLKQTDTAAKTAQKQRAPAQVG